MTDPASTFITEPIAEQDSSSGFDCGRDELNSYLARHAFANDHRGIGRTFVLRRRKGEEELPPLIGFYTLSMATLEGSKLPRKLRGNLPKYPLPVALIGRLAVDKRAKGRGFGDALLNDAFSRVLDIAENIGCFGIVVDAKDQSVVAYYERLGFEQVEAGGFPRRMFMLLATAREASPP